MQSRTLDPAGTCARRVPCIVNPVAGIDWPLALRAENRVRDEALRELALLLRRRLAVALRNHPGVGIADCEDFVQEALVRILARLDAFKGRSRFETWACTIAVNTAFTRLRRKHWRDVSLDALAGEASRLPEAFVVEPGATADSGVQSLLLAALRRAIAESLTERQRTGLRAELAGLPFDQIASLLNANRNATYKLLHDARRALKRRLTSEGFGVDDIRSAFAS